MYEIESHTTTLRTASLVLLQEAENPRLVPFGMPPLHLEDRLVLESLVLSLNRPEGCSC